MVSSSRQLLKRWDDARVAPVIFLSTPTLALRGMYTSEYNAWRGMRDRCTRSADKDWQWYGGRGIKLCKRWSGEGGFQRFMHDMGALAKGQILCRRNVNRDYTPSNTFWGTILDATNNRRSQRMLTIDGRKQSAASWAREAGLPNRQKVTNRLAQGWHPKAAVFGKVGETWQAAHQRLGVRSPRAAFATAKKWRRTP